MSQDGIHGIGNGPYHYCARCGDKCRISDMQWQRGKLLCVETCLDKWLVGQREQIIQSVLNDGKPELEPVEKLRFPEVGEQSEDIWR